MSGDGVDDIISATDGSPEGPIALLDHTISTDDEVSGVGLSQAPSQSLSTTFTHGSLRQNIARRKYQRSRWQEGKGSQTINRPSQDTNEGSSPDQPDTQDAIAEEEEHSEWGEGTVKKGGRNLKKIISGHKHKPTKIHTGDPNSHVDILYENQRGFFFFGSPRFSSNSLLNFDPTAWLDARFHPSAVDITNAQVPDPSWEWVWRTWYVDMSGDVDEEGWEYSFWFGKGHAWHGNHPWFHSFVRRRRWLRKRIRRKNVKVMETAHALNSDYFTIHPKDRPISPDGNSMTTSEKQAYTAATSSAWGAKTWEDQTETSEIASIPDLLQRLRSAAVDREKIILVKKFLDQGGDELHYLPENMETIMKLLVFQNSRRQLLAIIMHEFEAAEHHRDEHERRGEAENEQEKQHIDNLLKSVEAADDQCKQLEYWSDVKEMARDGEILGAGDHTHGWEHGWEGLDSSGAEKLTKSPTDALDDDKKVEKQDKGKQPVRDENALKASGGWVDGANDRKLSSSADSNANDVFFSPASEMSQIEAMRSSSQGDDTPTIEGQSREIDTRPLLPPSEDSELSRYESAESERSESTSTRKAPSEDEGDYDDATPLAGELDSKEPLPEGTNGPVDATEEARKDKGT